MSSKKRIKIIFYLPSVNKSWLSTYYKQMSSCPRNAKKIPLRYLVPFKTPQYGGMWEQQPVTHFHQGKMLFQWFTERSLTNTSSRYKGSCHQDKMRIAVGGPILASCLLLLLSWLRWLPWKQWGGKQNHLEQLLGSFMHEGLIFICCCLFFSS